MTYSQNFLDVFEAGKNIQTLCGFDRWARLPVMIGPANDFLVCVRGDEDVPIIFIVLLIFSRRISIFSLSYNTGTFGTLCANIQ